MRNRFILRVLQGVATSLFLSVMLLGCAEERKVTEDPAEIEKERQKHIDMTRRELEER